MTDFEPRIVGFLCNWCAYARALRGEIKINTLVTKRTPRGVIFIPYHFSECAANILTNPALDPIAKIPEFKVCAARIRKIE